MKILIILSFLALSTSAFSAELTCGSTKVGHKRTWPINKAAVSFFNDLGLTTCTGTSAKARIKAAVVAANHTVKFVVVSEEELNTAKKAMAKVGGRAGGPSL